MNMKRYLTMLIALVAIAMGAKAAVVSYGFSIGGKNINSNNNQSSPDERRWYYVHSDKTLHLKEWPGIINVDGDVNPDLKISVDNDIYHSMLEHDEFINFYGNGNHVICGDGSLHLQQDNTADSHLLGYSSIIALYGQSHVTILNTDLTLVCDLSRTNMTGYGFQLSPGCSLSFVHCGISITTNGEAIWSYGNITFTKCHLVEGSFNGNAIVDANGNPMSNITVVKDGIVKVSNMDFTVEQPTIGQTLPNTAVANGEGYYSIKKMEWTKYGTNNTLSNGYICKLGETYSVTIYSTLPNAFYIASDLTATVNGNPAEVSINYSEYVVKIKYTFPKLTAPCNNLSFTVDQPAVGQTLHYTTDINGEGCSFLSMGWEKYNGVSLWRNVFDGYTCALGDILRVVINVKLLDNYFFPDNTTATVNGKPAEVISTGYGVRQIIYAFPQLANTYYNLWVGGRQVNDQNQKDVLGDGGSVKYLTIWGMHYLTLENANITNTGNPDFEYTGYGRGIYSELQNLYVSVSGDNTIESTGDGIFFTGDLSLLGGDNPSNTLSIKGSSGIHTNAKGTVLNVYDMTLTAEGTSLMGIGGPIIGSKNCTLTVSGASTVVKANGSFLSLGYLKDLALEDGLEIASPAGAYFGSNNVRYANGDAISKQWVIIRGNTSISTGLEAMDNEQLTIDNASDSWFTIDGRKMSGKPTKKGIYIHNGRAVVH